MTIQIRRQKVFFTIDRSCKGFTLLEMILGAVVFALVTMSLFQIFFNGLETYKRAQYTSKTYIQMFRVFDALDADIAAAVKFDYSAADPQWASFHGDGTSLRFVIKTPEGLKVVRYGTVPAVGDKDMLVRDIRSLEDALHQRDHGSRQVLTKGLVRSQGFVLTFTEIPDTDSSAKAVLVWKKGWEATSLPIAVKVNLRYGHYQTGQRPLEFNRIFYVENR